MRAECSSHRFEYQSVIPIERLVTKVADRAQKRTIKAAGRPYGVGFLVIGYDVLFPSFIFSQNAPRLFELDPSGNVIDCYASAMGARSQSSRTYLEKHLESFATSFY